MQRFDIIEKIGREYLISNIENDEFSYPKALNKLGKKIDKKIVTSSDGTVHKDIDLRFVNNNITVLVETKNNYDKWDKEKLKFQMQAYVNYEQVLTGNKIISILANTEDDRIKVWWGSDLIIDDSHQLKNQYALKTFEEYADLYLAKKNNKEEVIKNTYILNEILHKYGINEKIRSQFVGTCLLALKNGLKFKGLKTKQVIAGIEETITDLLDKDLNKAQKLVILKNKVLDSQDVRELKDNEIQEVLTRIRDDILLYINDRSTMGQDILNLFFTTFNKYVGKTDKNQAFTPDHIVHFMCQVVGINRHSKVLDPCCGSGAFLVRAMTEAMDDCANEEERNLVKKKQIFGIENEETAFGLSTTNMLIHGDGNSNVIQGSCFEKKEFIQNANINVVLMNPPYNAQAKMSNPEYVKTWGKNTKEDPSQGLHYAYYIASLVKTGKMAILLPMQCAIGSENAKEIKKFKELMLQEHTLDAVFSLPADIFHPGANANACCMIFDLGIRHYKTIKNEQGKVVLIPKKETFLGYFKDDGFIKKKNLGRIEATKNNSNEGVWSDIESKWLELYRTRTEQAGLSVLKPLTSDDEWLCEAYLEIDSSCLCDSNFGNTVRDFASYKIKSSKLKYTNEKLDTKNYHYFKLKEIFSHFESGKVNNKSEQLEEGDDIYYLGAKKNENGIMQTCAYNQNLVSKGNCIVFICDGQGSIGYNNYMDQDFIATINLELGYSEKLNKYNALFLVTVLDLERPKFSFGRKRKPTLAETKIMLPSIKKENGNIEPDWEFMERYIKNLQYSELI